MSNPPASEEYDGKGWREVVEAFADLNEKINFLCGFEALFKEQILTDIQLKPGDGGPSMSVHGSLLASRSVIFRTMLDSDAYKAPPNGPIALSELTHEELESLVEFLYTGSLPESKIKKHIYCLTRAADKYEIPYLLKFCERYMLRSMHPSNALDILEISRVCSIKTLEGAAFKYITKHMKRIVFSTEYEDFVRNNPDLAVQITRAYFKR